MKELKFDPNNVAHQLVVAGLAGSKEQIERTFGIYDIIIKG